MANNPKLPGVQAKATCRIIDKDGNVKGEFELTTDDGLEVNEEQVKKLIEEKDNAS